MLLINERLVKFKIQGQILQMQLHFYILDVATERKYLNRNIK